MIFGLGRVVVFPWTRLTPFYPFWSQKRSIRLCKDTSFSKMFSILRLMTTVWATTVLPTASIMSGSLGPLTAVPDFQIFQYTRPMPNPISPLSWFRICKDPRCPQRKESPGTRHSTAPMSPSCNQRRTYHQDRQVPPDPNFSILSIALRDQLTNSMTLILRAMWRQAPKFETGQDKTWRKAGKIREREDRGEKRNATAFVESRKIHSIPQYPSHN